MSKRNWSSVDANNDRKPHAAHMVQRATGGGSECISRINWAVVEAAFMSKSDPERTNYSPVILNRRIVK